MMNRKNSSYPTTNGICMIPLMTIIGNSLIIGNVPNIYVLIRAGFVLVESIFPKVAEK